RRARHELRLQPFVVGPDPRDLQGPAAGGPRAHDDRARATSRGLAGLPPAAPRPPVPRTGTSGSGRPASSPRGGPAMRTLAIQGTVTGERPGEVSGASFPPVSRGRGASVLRLLLALGLAAA